MVARTNLTEAEALFIQQQRVARLATADAEGHPHVVPVCYAFDGARFYIPLDEKPKRVAAVQLKRVRNIEARPEVSLVIDRYDDDWSQLGYLQVAASAELLGPGDEGHATAIVLLRERYPQYRTMALEQSQVIALTPTAVVSWRVESRVHAADEFVAGAWAWGGFSPISARTSVGARVSGPARAEGGVGGDDRGGALGALTTRRPAMALCRADSSRGEARAGGGDGRRVAAHLGDGR